MTTYGAYDAGLPCKNPNCKSHGRPHPNCRCYGDMAEGGDVLPFCSEARPHKPDCEYYAAGGPVEVALDKLNGAPQMTPEDHVAGALAAMGGHRLLGEGVQNADDLLFHAQRGHKAIKQGLRALFAEGGEVPAQAEKRHHEKIQKHVDKGAVTETLKALEDKPHLLAQSHSTEHMLLSAAKGRVGQYLTNLKPAKHQPKLAFDEEPDDQDAKRLYDEATGVAAAPLSVLSHIKDKTLEPTHLTHLMAMYPELHEHLQKKVTEKITERQLAGSEPPDYHVRQGLSMLMGVPLSSDMTPAAIQAAQATFQTQKTPAAQGSRGKQASSKGTHTKSALSKSDQAFLTGPQSLEKRQQRQS